jgi:transcriptional regulator with XRE-family HTH domain
MSQAELARDSGMTQNNLSRLESPDYGKQTISSLKRIADALDVALVVRFVPFSRYINWLSGTPQVDEGLNQSALAVPSFGKEEAAGLVEAIPQEKPMQEGVFNMFVDVRPYAEMIGTFYGGTPFTYEQSQLTTVLNVSVGIGEPLGAGFPSSQPIIPPLSSKSPNFEGDYART